MGLSASQARFLAVTSRKANCEFRSMELAQQKLSMSRELQAATEDYQDAIQAAKLVWDLTPTDPGNYVYDLSYDLLMNPSEYNKYMPYLLARQDGKIAMNDKFMKAAEGIFNMVQDPTTGTWSTDGGILYGGKVVYPGDKIYDANGHEVDYSVVKGEMFAKYIDALRDNKAISSGLANSMLNTDGNLQPKYVYFDKAGLGDELYGREVANVMNMTNLLSYIDYITINTANGYFEPGSTQAALAENLIFDFNRTEYYDTPEEWENEKRFHQAGGEAVLGGKRADLSCNLNYTWDKESGSTCVLKNGDYLNNASFGTTGKICPDTSSEEYQKLSDADKAKYGTYSSRSFTLADLLNEDITMVVTGQQNYSEILEMMSHLINNVSNMNTWTLITDDVDIWYDKMKASYTKTAQENGSDANLHTYADLVRLAKEGGTDSEKAKSSLAILNYFDKLAKSMYALLMPNPENPGKVEQNAFYTALADIITRFRNIDGYNGSDPNYVTISDIPFNSESCAKGAVRAADGYNCWVKYGNEWAISLSNLTETFLTNFVNGMDAYQDECLIDKKAGKSTYITDYGGYLYNVNIAEEAEEHIWESEFYSIIFNSICTNGMYENEQVQENEYLNNALMNGQLFVVSKNADNYYYQSKYTEAYGENIRKETDLEAVAQAEREYEYKKSKINYKEDEIDIEMKSIDAEISALTTEMQSVQNLIKGSIDKTFKMFQSS
ncbi:MAG: hypothetical protein VZR09_10710 [Candidatus Gastranaerophilaceae bacterium]|nr:hypothetical protein [Candidatus Gastranaerophilaceae bacterium]